MAYLSQLPNIKINKNVKNVVTWYHKMVKHTNYSLAIADELFECVWPLCGIKSERVKSQNHFDICVKSTWWIYLLQS